MLGKSGILFNLRYETKSNLFDKAIDAMLPGKSSKYIV